MRRRGGTAFTSGRGRGKGIVAKLVACRCAAENASGASGVAASVGDNCGPSWLAII
jgi:hypothetical protein